MPSEKHSLRTARAIDLISSLINTASSRDVPFHKPQRLQSLYHGATFELLCAPILSSQPHIGDDLQLAYYGFSVRHEYCSYTSHSCNRFNIAET